MAFSGGSLNPNYFLRTEYDDINRELIRADFSPTKKASQEITFITVSPRKETELHISPRHLKKSPRKLDSPNTPSSPVKGSELTPRNSEKGASPRHKRQISIPLFNSKSMSKSLPPSPYAQASPQKESLDWSQVS
jgi:hypothetical protein